MTSPTSPPATWSSSTGVPSAANAAHAARPAAVLLRNHNATQKMTLEDGTELTPALGIGSFAEKTLVAAGQCTKITADISPEQYAAIGPLGCGVTANPGRCTEHR